MNRNLRESQAGSIGRPTRLAAGTLLAVIAGMLLLVREQAVDQAAMWTMMALFGVPGLLLLFSGLLPPGGMSGSARMVFVPKRLFGGLLLSVAGVVVLYLFYEVVHIAPTVLVVGAMLAVPGGLLIAGSCWTEKP